MSVDGIRINDCQKRAIQYTKGPLLIVAGAGTGKTTAIVEKIKYIVKENLAKPQDILCLTFTEKAAFEMEERVDRAMPYGFFQMCISTFHSFADDILRDEIHNIGLNPAYTIMSLAQSLILLRKNLFNLKLKYYRPLSNPDKFISSLLQHFSRLRDENIDEHEYANWVKKLSKNLKNHADLKNPLMADEIAKSKELSYAYDYYQKIKMENDKMDFGDLIYYVNKLFKERPNILKQYQDKFKYVMVDEFQDTNIAQYELIKLLCPPDHKPKLTVVGDDSQAIYKFRGASVSNILAFMDDYNNAKQISLTQNYRSNQTILDHAYKLIQNNNPDTLESKLGISKKLHSNIRNEDNAVKLKLFSNGDDEALWISEKIEKLHKDGNTFGGISILVRANSHSDPIINALKRRGIPYQFLGPGSLFKQPEVKDLIAYISFLSNLNDTVSLFRVLSMEFLKISSEDLILLISFAKQISLSLYQTIVIYLSFYVDEWKLDVKSNYQDYAPIISRDSRNKLINIIKIIKKHLSKIKTYTAGEILFSFLEDTGYLDYLSHPKTKNQEKQTLNISSFFKKIKEIENTQEDKSVFAIFDFLSMSMELGESPIVGSTDFSEIDAVNILTIHSAKGLEFPIVFLPNLIQGRFPTTRRKEQIPIADDLIKSQLPSGDYHLQEERRLFYVGLTRAMKLVFITASELYGGGLKKRKISPFVFETIDEKIIIQNKTQITDKSAQLSIFDFQKKEGEVILPPTELKSLSYTQLQTYQLCPLQYKYQYIFRLPTPPSGAASFGSTIHIVLQKFYKKYIDDKLINMEYLYKLLDLSWIPVGYRSSEHESRMKIEAKEMLENYFHSFHSKNIQILDLEKHFKIKVESSIYLTGKIDRVDKKPDGTIELIDYKTGKRPDDKKLKKDIQLAIYTKAASDPGLYNKPIEKINLSFYFLQTREKITFNRTSKDILEIQDLVKSTANSIRQKKFSPNVGHWCNFCSFRMICEAWK